MERVQAALDTDRATRERLADRDEALRRVDSLTPREREVMALLVAGGTSKDVASILGLSVRTVEGHRRQVLSKLRVTSAAQLVRLAMIVQES